LLIEDVPLVVYCPHCQARRALPSIQALVCDACGQPTPDVREGRELELVALEIAE
jgi:hydrogenase nickel incorporation protein HypA/HybF